jgi:hypothetical protein
MTIRDLDCCIAHASREEFLLIGSHEGLRGQALEGNE